MESKTKERLTEDLKTRFWSKWERAKEIDKPRLVGELSGVQFPHMPPNIFNSYCIDLYEFLQKKYKFDPMEKM
jgi:hypothetical protein